MRMVVYIAPHERAEAMEAYEDLLSADQRQQILWADDDVWFELHRDGDKVELRVDQRVEDEKGAPANP